MSVGAETEPQEQSLLGRGIGYAAIGFFLVSLAPVIVASADVHGVAIALWRSLIGLVLVGAVAAARGQLSWQVILRAGPAGVCFGVGVGMFFWASQLTSIANASLLATLQPVVLLLAGVALFGEVMVRRDLFLGAVAIGGAALIVVAGDSGGTGDLKGDVLAAVSVMIGAGYFISGKRVLETVDVMPFMTGVFAWAVVVLAIAGFASREPLVPSNSSDWLRIAAVGVGSGAGHLFLNYAQNKAPLNLIGVVQLLVPVSATLLALWFLDQSVSMIQLIGITIAIGALALQAAFRLRSTDSG